MLHLLEGRASSKPTGSASCRARLVGAGAIERSLLVGTARGQDGSTATSPATQGDLDLPGLVTAAAGGDQQAWNALVRRFTPLLLSVARSFRLTDADVDDVVQTVWLRLVEHLGDLRDPQALPKWIIVTARREALRLRRLGERTVPADPQTPKLIPEQADHHHVEDALIAQQGREALLSAFATLNQAQRDLLSLLCSDPPLPYAEISRRLSIPVGSIGPTRARALSTLRRAPELRGHRAERDDHGGDRRAPQRP